MRTAATVHNIDDARTARPIAALRDQPGPARQSHCQTCALRELCLPAGLSAPELEKLEKIFHRHHSLKRGQHLFRSGDTLKSIYAIRTGFLKSSLLHDDGREQVTGFHMMGELVGMDAIGNGKHLSDAVALEDTEVCEAPFDDFETLARELPSLQRQFHRIISREIARDHGVMLLLGSMRAEERLAAFLLNLAQRFKARGYSPSSFHLRMTREDIGSFLGLKLETVSRAFSHLQAEGIIAVKNKSIEIRDSARLHAAVGLPVPLH